MKTRSRRGPDPREPAARVVLVAIAGGSGSGKTWLAAKLRRQLGPSAGLISLDDFYRDLAHVPLAERPRTNFDSPAAIDWVCLTGALRAIAAGQAPLLPRYDFTRHTRADRPRRWRRRPIVLVEGLWPWVRARLRRWYALRIFRAEDADRRYARRLRRDIRQRGRTPAEVERQWVTQVEPMFARFVALQRRTADVIVGGELEVTEVARLAKRIRALAR
ncbi:MAG: uridine kinase [Verrucomicrobia bacterium]|nr:uridine kinase [Verrucomicrobiota bacterium]